jgi:hypothetical protein
MICVWCVICIFYVEKKNREHPNIRLKRTMGVSGCLSMVGREFGEKSPKTYKGTKHLFFSKILSFNIFLFVSEINYFTLPITLKITTLYQTRDPYCRRRVFLFFLDGETVLMLTKRVKVSARGWTRQKGQDDPACGWKICVRSLRSRAPAITPLRNQKVRQNV